MFARTLIASASILAATLCASSALADQAAATKPLPAKLYLINVDTSECFDAADGGAVGKAESFAMSCASFQALMPEQRRMGTIKGRVASILCPKVETTDAAGKAFKQRVCRTSINVAKLNDVQIAFLAHQLNVLN